MFFFYDFRYQKQTTAVFVRSFFVFGLKQKYSGVLVLLSAKKIRQTQNEPLFSLGFDWFLLLRSSGKTINRNGVGFWFWFFVFRFWFKTKKQTSKKQTSVLHAQEHGRANRGTLLTQNQSIYCQVNLHIRRICPGFWCITKHQHT